MRKKCIIIGLVILTIIINHIALFGQASNFETSLVIEIARMDMNISSNKVDIPSSFLKFLRKKAKRNVVFSYPNETYNETDLYVKNMPNCELIEVGLSKDCKTGLILFNSGGYGITRRVLIFQKITKKSFLFEERIVGQYVMSILDLQKLLMNG